MNLKRIRIFTRNAILIVLSMIVIAGATGLSYKAHYCHGNLSGIAFYTELGIQKPASCGCKEDFALNSAHQQYSSIAHLKKTGCCSDISSFKKLSILSPVNNFSPFTNIQPAVIALFCSDFNAPDYKSEELSVFCFEFRPPPLAGRKLVLFLTQLRIPLISYNC